MQTEPTLASVRRAMKRKDYAIFDRGDYNLNIFGVRAAEDAADAFNDRLGVFYKVRNKWRFFAWPGTTDPGTYWRRHLINPGGTAALAEGQYRGCWQLGWHRGQIRALVQVRPMTVYRDADRDETLAFDPQTMASGVYGINLHSAWTLERAVKVEKWSAGCQVPQVRADFDKLLALCEHSAGIYGNSFTYTLLHENDLAA